MRTKDFFFSYSQTISFEIEKKSYFKALRKSFYFPCKFILNKIKIILSIKKKDIDQISNSKNESLDDLFLKFNADKGSQLLLNGKIVKGHNYSPFYVKYFNKYKNKKKLNILEIGTLRGAAAASFYQFFPGSLIYCLDVSPFQTFYYSKSIRTIYCNTRSKKSINNAVKYLDCKFDIIIDDGSHNVKDQILTLSAFITKLKKGGTYVIEDINQYTVFPELNSDNLKNGVKSFLKTINRDSIKIPECLTIEESKNIKNNIKKVFFEKGKFIYKNKNISDIVFLQK
tara:strand:+ start:1132 stop:1983 length:852 start_codon:yes stop_codon:yes gene_type:complete